MDLLLGLLCVAFIVFGVSMPLLPGGRVAGGRALLVGAAYVGGAIVAWVQKSFVPLILTFGIMYWLKPLLVPDLRLKNQLASTNDSPPSEPPKKGVLAQIATGIASAVIIGIVIILVRSLAPESESAPEKSPQTPALAPVQSNPVRPSSAALIPTQNASGAPQSEVKPPERNQSTEGPSTESRGIGTQTHGATISPDERYAELVKEKEQKIYQGTDEIVRCRLEIPKKTLGDESDRQAWLKSLREAGANEQRALVILSEAQCGGGK